MIAAVAMAVTADAVADAVSVILVHRAFSDGSAWNKVIPIREEAGISVSAAQLNLSSLQEDTAIVTRFVDLKTAQRFWSAIHMVTL